MNAAASATNVPLSVARATRAGGPMACRSSCTRATPLSGTCSATAIRSSMCATRSSRRRWLSSPRRKTRGHTICKSTATSCWPSTARISGPCSNMRPSKITMRKSLIDFGADRAALRRGSAHFRHLEPGKPTRNRLSWHMPGFGAHRIWWVGGRYAYVSVHFEGFIDHVLAVIDVSDPAQPKSGGTLVAAWHEPGCRRDAACLVRQAYGAASSYQRREPRLCRVARWRLHHS